MRSLAKAVGWRLTAGSITFCTSFYFTKSLSAAFAIVGSDFISKSGTMYIGERLFNKVQIGRTEGGKESPYRSLAKALIWRLFAFVNTMVVSLIVVKDAAAGAKVHPTLATLSHSMPPRRRCCWFPRAPSRLAQV